jgi:hypothetical protein
VGSERPCRRVPRRPLRVRGRRVTGLADPPDVAPRHRRKDQGPHPARGLRGGGRHGLSRLLAGRPPKGQPGPVAAFRYFVRT